MSRTDNQHTTQLTARKTAASPAPSSVILDLDDPFATVCTPPPVAVLGTGEGSLSRETSDLRRTRIGAAAIFLAVIYALLFVLAILPDETRTHWGYLSRLPRLIIAVGVAALVRSRIRLTHKQIRYLEYLLFGGTTLLLSVSQYVINLELIDNGYPTAMLLFAKNGVVQLFALMVLYGLFIPNSARRAAYFVIPMTISLATSQTLVFLRPQTISLMKGIVTGDGISVNLLLMSLSASLTIYGAHVLYVLRLELHQAKKFGQYQLRQKIGSGGMGEVYLAQHDLLKRPCALKLIRPESGSNPVALARFEREVQSAASLNHPNTIAIYDYGHSDDGTFYYVMECLKGTTLGDLVDEFGPLTPGRLIYILRQVCAGMAQAHEFGLVHRDLKPSNIFVAEIGGEYDFAKVLDFGLVKITKEPQHDQLTAERTIHGTPLYMAPEQAIGEKDVGPAADIYALGAIAYFAITGRPVFERGTSFAVLIAHVRDHVSPPSVLRPDIPHDLEQVILKCLEKAPSDRFASIKELNRELGNCQCASDWSAEKAEIWWRKQGLHVRLPVST